MNVKNFFTFAAILIALFGLSLVFAMDFMGQQYLTNPGWVNSAVKLLAQGYGTLLLALAVACWYLRDSEPSLGRSAMFLLLLVQNLALVVIHSIAVLNGVETSMGWVQVLIAVVFCAWSWMLFRQQQTTMA